MMEQWKQIQKATQYEVSSLGRIKSSRTSRILKLKLQKNTGYYTVNLSVSRGVPHTFKVHRLVAEAFCNGYDESLHVDHRDRNPKNNKANNLRWLTPKQNNWNRSLTVAKIEKIISLHEVGLTPQQIHDYA